MSAIRHTGAKSCYIPRNSKTGKRRNLAIVNFATAQDLEKAARKHIFMFGLKLRWENHQKDGKSDYNQAIFTQSEEEMSTDQKESE